MRLALGLISLGVLIWLGWIAFSFVWGGLTALEPAILSPLLLTSGTVIGVVVTVVGGQALQRRAAREEAHRSRKVEIYERFMQQWAEFLQLGKPKDQRKQSSKVDPAVVDYLAQFTREVILWGSDGVLREYSRFMASARTVEGSPSASQETIFAFEKVLSQIRKDLGHSNWGFKEGDILRLFITDIDRALTSRKRR